MTSHPLPSGRFPLKVHFDVLLRFLAVSRNGAEPTTADAVEAGGLPAGAARENVAFLSDIGFLIEEAAGKFKPTPVAMQFLNTVAGDEQRGRKLLRSIVAKLWFGRLAVPGGASIGGLQGAELRSALGREAGVAPEDGEAIGVLLEYLVFTGLIPPQVSEPAATPSSAQAPPKSGRGGKSKGAADDGVEPKSQDRDWKELRTEDFELKVRSTRQAIRRLRKHLDLIEEDVRDAGP
jgi:hypothetical protein